MGCGATKHRDDTVQRASVDPFASRLTIVASWSNDELASWIAHVIDVDPSELPRRVPAPVLIRAFQRGEADELLREAGYGALTRNAVVERLERYAAGKEEPCLPEAPWCVKPKLYYRTSTLA